MNEIKFEPVLFSRASEYIERKIAESILAGKLKARDRFPTEKEMARQFGVSLVTLREALRGLEIFGLIEKEKRTGWWGFRLRDQQSIDQDRPGIFPHLASSLCPASLRSEKDHRTHHGPAGQSKDYGGRHPEVGKERLSL